MCERGHQGLFANLPSKGVYTIFRLLRYVIIVVAVILLFGCSPDAENDEPGALPGCVDAPADIQPMPKDLDPADDDAVVGYDAPTVDVDPDIQSRCHLPAVSTPEEVVCGLDGGLVPNELGQVPILMYHRVGDHDDTWVRSRERFRKDLEFLYQEGYRPVPLADYLRGRIQLPAGKSPVILTFDDGLSSQFRWKDGVFGEVDPDCAVGILLEFSEQHPGFEPYAVFYLNSPRPFAPMEEGLIDASLRWLVDRGFELGNHTHYHANLAEISNEEVQEAIARTQDMITTAIPGYQVSSLALPYGVWPRQRELAVQGLYGDVRYHHACVLLVGAEPAPSPFARDFDPLRTPRIRASDDQWELWFDQLDRNPMRRYVSDGNPDTIAVPEALYADLDRASVGTQRIHWIKEGDS